MLVATLCAGASAPSIATVNSGQMFLPPYLRPADRMGFDVAYTGVDTVDVATLGAGWYGDWRTQELPAQPASLTYVQLVRLQAGADPSDPDQVTTLPSAEEIAQIAQRHPGSLWMIGNEPDSYYHGAPLLPAVYAHTYQRVAGIIRQADPDALLANGALVQPTPCRLAYLGIVWNTYLATYGERMPVDVWNMHGFILREVYGEYGASTPPGVPKSCGIDYATRDADNLGILNTNIRRLRQWLADHGEREKPLIISEYGILWPYRPDYIFRDEDGRDFSPARVIAYMTGSFDLFLTETDPATGYSADDNRLVQAFAWYSLADDQQYNGHLFSSESKAISPMGQAYADYAAALPDPALPDLSIRLTVDTSALDSMDPLEPGETVAVDLPAAGQMANLGRVAVEDAAISCPELGYETTVDLAGRYEPGSTVVLPLPPYLLTAAGLHEVTCTVDPEAHTTDGRRWNNQATAMVDARLLLSDGYRVYLPQIHPGSP
ncbi:MAG: hypothetical protein GXX94_09225 [Chloroflexi bacterium]|nr:hypothetical protein [Chloroflexota bacterium]